VKVSLVHRLTIKKEAGAWKICGLTVDVSGGG
jgi:hypothetical protein